MNIRKNIFLTSLLSLYSFLTFGQTELYMPATFQKAYKIHSRSFDGLPGINYWQNHARYDIEVNIEPGQWKISGQQKTVYYNNSPDSLGFIIIKTFPNHYKKGSARANSIPLEDLTEGMILSDLQINKKPVDLEDYLIVREQSTYIKLSLADPIPPGDSMRLEVNWQTQIPPIYVNRIGAYDDESAFMGYWYPRIAVFDDIDGWDDNEYLGSQEFYSDYSDFNVKLTVPESYIVWATGELQNPEEVLNKKEFERYKQVKKSSEPVIIRKGRNSKNNYGEEKTWIYHAENVTDFAAGISNNFKWEASGITANGKTFTSNLVYDPASNAKTKNLIDTQNASLTYLSEMLPGVTYPYPSFTSFFGVKVYDGMEFPMMANNGFGAETENNAGVTFHEIAHTYFPFFVGINEVRYAWMEEGWASFFTIKFIQSYFEGTELANVELYRRRDSYLYLTGNQSETPLFTPSNHLIDRKIHVLMSYSKPAFMYLTLEDMLGEGLFKTCLKTYIERWEGKHPTPYDFIFTFNNISKQNLDWFWNAWIFQYGYADLAIKGMDGTNVLIENIGRLPMPVFLKVKYKDGGEIVIHKTAEVWSNNDSFVKIQLDDTEHILSVELITDSFPDTDKSNNMLKIN